MLKLASRKKSTSIYSKIIKLWPFGGAAGRYSHSELVFSDGMTFSSDEADNGTRWKEKIENPADWDFIDIPCTEAEENRVRKFCDGELNCKYDKKGILFSFLPIPVGWQSKDRWFCSEICVAALQQIGLLVGVTPASVAPSRLHKLLQADLPAWQGSALRYVVAGCALLMFSGCATVEINVTGDSNKVQVEQPKSVTTSPAATLTTGDNTLPSGMLP